MALPHISKPTDCAEALHSCMLTKVYQHVTAVKFLCDYSLEV